MCLLSAGCPRAVAVQLLTLDYCILNRVHGVMSTHKLPKITQLIGGLPCVVQMTQKILEAEGEGDSVQLDFFLKGNLALEKNSRRKPHFWLPDQVRQLYRLTPSPELSTLHRAFTLRKHPSISAALKPEVS